MPRVVAAEVAYCCSTRLMIPLHQLCCNQSFVLLCERRQKQANSACRSRRRDGAATCIAGAASAARRRPRSGTSNSRLMSEPRSPWRRLAARWWPPARPEAAPDGAGPEIWCTPRRNRAAGCGRTHGQPGGAGAAGCRAWPGAGPADLGARCQAGHTRTRTVARGAGSGPAD